MREHIEIIVNELKATGLPWDIRSGGKHRKIYLGSHCVGVIGRGGDDRYRRALKNVVSQIRRKARELQ